IELELEFRIQLQPGANLQPGRDDETDGTVLAPERAPEREAVLSQRQVEPRALERPAPVVLESVRVEAARVLADRHASTLAQHGKPLVKLRLVGDVLALPGLARAGEDDGRRHPRELARHRSLAPFRRERLDLELEPGHLVEEPHRVSPYPRAAERPRRCRRGCAPRARNRRPGREPRRPATRRLTAARRRRLGTEVRRLPPTTPGLPVTGSTFIRR